MTDKRVIKKIDRNEFLLIFSGLRSLRKLGKGFGSAKNGFQKEISEYLLKVV